MVLSFEKQGV